MVTFQVDDMTCGHCVGTITQAVKAADKDASVRIDLSRHLVEIELTGLDADRLHDAIREAGYTPVPTSATVPPAARSAPRSGCCCG